MFAWWTPNRSYGSFRLCLSYNFACLHAKMDKVIRELLNIQEDRCAISGLPMQFRGAHTDDNMLVSLDRIDSQGHYERGNLQLVCRFINFWKQASNDSDFRRLLNVVRGIDMPDDRPARGHKYLLMAHRLAPRSTQSVVCGFSEHFD